ncbi:hypothetical protein DdX_20357 [Ditylenchus destructor]|uniref:Galectin domain-containing protein n=1 Tax=Ditylenchus destructor TaxID=166010 RepID=A0AAD4MLI2_9BILA|nr:hypothetical protein DdX_20357 [Ditylenchus destructor]
MPKLFHPPGWNSPLKDMPMDVEPGMIYWITGHVPKFAKNDLKIYLIAGGKGEFGPGDAMEHCVLEVRAYHREDRITYGSLKSWGEEWNYADATDNPIFYRYQEDDLFNIRFRFTDDFVQVWVNSRMMTMYLYKYTINSYKEITSVWIPENSDLKLRRVVLIKDNITKPYIFRFDPPITKQRQEIVMSGIFMCRKDPKSYLEIILHNETGYPKPGQLDETIHFSIRLQCLDYKISVWSDIVGHPTKRTETHVDMDDLVNGFELSAAVDGEGIKLSYPNHIDPDESPISRITVKSAGVFRLDLLRIQN